MVESATSNCDTMFELSNSNGPVFPHAAHRYLKPSNPKDPNRKFVFFNISGQIFMLSRALLKRFPDSRLANLDQLEDYWVDELNAYYFDRDPGLFNTVLNICRYNVVNIPPGCDEFMFQSELQFWNIDNNELDNTFDDGSARLEKDFAWMEHRDDPPEEDCSKATKFRFKVWCFLTDPLGPYTRYRKCSMAYAFTTIAITVLYMVLFGMSTNPQFRVIKERVIEKKLERNISVNVSYLEDKPPQCHIKIDCFLKSNAEQWLYISILVLMVFFIIETALRLLTCSSYKSYFSSLINWIDIIATLCLFLAIPFHMDVIDLEEPTKGWALATIGLQAFQVLRIFKILQYATFLDGLMVLLLTLKASLKELIILVTYILMTMFFFSMLITFAEITAPVDKGIPDCLIGYWWAVITMTTVGYGDYYPQTTPGYFVGVLCAIAGLIITALPVAIIGNNFNAYWEHNKKRKRLLAARLLHETEYDGKNRDTVLDEYCKIKGLQCVTHFDNDETH